MYDQEGILKDLPLSLRREITLHNLRAVVEAVPVLNDTSQVGHLRTVQHRISSDVECLWFTGLSERDCTRTGTCGRVFELCSCSSCADLEFLCCVLSLSQVPMPPNELVIAEGEPPSDLYFIASGSR
jgi:hypothetical protein